MSLVIALLILAAIGLAVVGLGMIVFDAHRTRDQCDQAIDKLINSVQLEVKERGKLARRLAQAETKIAFLQKALQKNNLQK